MDFKLETEFSKADIFKEVDALKKQVDGARPLPKDVEDRVMQKLRLEWNYNSNAIEGNKLNYGETTALLMHGITAKGKPLKDHLDIQGHNDAINFLLSIIKEDRPFTEADIRQLHEITLVESYIVTAQADDGKSTTKQIKLGAYKTSPNHVKTITGETHYYALPEETPAKMQELMEWYNEIINDKSVHPIVIASLYHHRFTEIHPFDDGNGRVARLLMNLILMKSGYPPVVVKMDDRQNYYALLSRADVGEGFPFIEYIAERLQTSLRIYIKGIKGEDIDEDEDIEKEIKLLEIQLKTDVTVKEKKTVALVKDIFEKEILPLLFKISTKLNPFEKYFFDAKYWLEFLLVNDGERKTKYEYLSVDNLPTYLDYFSNNKDVTVEFETDFKEYRNPDNNFNISLKLKIDFQVYFYKISIDNQALISKFYHENITFLEQSVVMKHFIRNFKDIITKKQQSPKSN
ncbi:MAG TPA: Fic family protein [Mucilaginibacter sp.]|jgi:Fic family protein|nr:Fic family protein [Mucilaginibacter sp.]